MDNIMVHIQSVQIIKQKQNNTTQYHTVGAVPVPNFSTKIVERGKIDTLNTQIHDRSLFKIIQ